MVAPCYGGGSLAGWLAGLIWYQRYDAGTKILARYPERDCLPLNGSDGGGPGALEMSRAPG